MIDIVFFTLLILLEIIKKNEIIVIKIEELVPLKMTGYYRNLGANFQDFVVQVFDLEVSLKEVIIVIVIAVISKSL